MSTITPKSLDQNKVIQSFWSGPITTMERLCIKSYLDNGHEFHLYTYESLEGLPSGVIVKSADEIVPRKRKEDFSNPQQFADYFRYSLLYEKGGWWMDMDTVCLRHYDFTAEYVFALAPTKTFYLYNGFLKVPPHSALMQYCMNQAATYTKDKLESASFQDIGPTLITHAVRDLDLSGFVLPGDTFDPVHWDKAVQIIDPNIQWDLSKPYCVHLFHAMWNHGHEAHNYTISPDTNGTYPDGCLYERLKKKYLTPPKVSIVITTFNRPELLRPTLESFRRQKFTDYEVIVVDDGTDDQTKGICNEFGVTYIKLRTTADYRCPSYPNNVGVQYASGDIVILQNAECKHVDPNTIEKLANSVKANNAVFARVIGLRADGTEEWVMCGTESQRPFFFCGAIKKSWFTRLHGMDEDYPTGGYDDNDFADRLRKEGVQFVFSNTIVHHLYHPRPTISVEAALACYNMKTAAMAAGTLGTVRNLNGWGGVPPMVAVAPVDFLAMGLSRPQFQPKKNLASRYSADGLSIDWWDSHAR